MIPAMNMTHAHYFVVNDKMLLPILRACTSCTDHYTSLKMLNIFTLCIAVEQSAIHTNRHPVAPPPPPPNNSNPTLPPHVYHLMACAL